MLVLCRDHSTGINGDQRGTLDLATQKLALGISGYSCHWVKLSLSKYYVDAIWMPSFSIQSRCNPRPSTNSGQSHILQCSARGLPSWTCTSVASLYRPYIREAQEGRNELLTKEPFNSSLPFLMSDSSGFQMNSSPVCRQLPKEQTMLLKRRTLPELCQFLSKKEPLGTVSISSTNLPRYSNIYMQCVMGNTRTCRAHPTWNRRFPVIGLSEPHQGGGNQRPKAIHHNTKG